MKILIINTYCKKGSIGKIAYGLFSYLINLGHECMLLYGGDEQYPEEKQLINISCQLELQWHNKMAYITGLHGFFSPIATAKVKKIIDEFNPDIIQLFNLHGDFINIFSLLNFIKNYPIVYSMLDEYPFLGHCCYSFDCRKYENKCLNCKEKLNQYPRSLFFRTGHLFYEMKCKAYGAIKNKVFVGPQWVVDCAKKSSLLKKEKLEVVDEFIDTERVFYPKDTAKILNRLNLTKYSGKIVLNVAPTSNPRKGIRYYIELAERMQDDNIVFVQIGMDVDSIKIPNNYIAIGYVDNQELLADYYSMADLLVCTSMADTMPNVCLDALACGTPVLGFDISGIPYVAEKPLGTFVEARNIDRMMEVIRSAPKKDKQLVNACREYACSRYSLDIYGDRMNSIYKKIMGEVE